MEDVAFIREKIQGLGCYDADLIQSFQNIEAKVRLLNDIQATLCDPDLYLVYKHTDPCGRVYIGITRNLPALRWNEGDGYKAQRKFYKAIQKYGWIHFKHEIVAAGLSENDAKEVENALIFQHRSNEEAFGYNTHVNVGVLTSTLPIPANPSGADEPGKNAQDDFFIFPDQLRKKLNYVGIYSIEDLTGYTYKELTKLPRIGGKTADRISIILKQHSLSLSPEPEKGMNGSVFKAGEIDAILNWFEHTHEPIVCSKMVFEQVLGCTRRQPRNVSNEFHQIVRMKVRGWKLYPNKSGRARCGSYGKQICYVRDDFEYFLNSI